MLDLKPIIANFLSGGILLASAFMIFENALPFVPKDFDQREFDLQEVTTEEFQLKARRMSSVDSIRMQRCENLIDTISHKIEKCLQSDNYFIIKLLDQSWFGYHPYSGKLLYNRKSWKKRKPKKYNIDGFLFEHSKLKKHLPFLDPLISNHFDYWNQKLTGQIILIPPQEEDKNIVEYGMLYFKLNGHSEKYYFANASEFAGFFNEKFILSEDQFYIKPVDKSIISSRYNLERVHPVTKETKPHFGTDYAGKKGDYILSIAKGKVIKKGKDSRNGNYVKIQHDKNYATQYLHMDRIADNVKLGGYVDKAQIIGYMGETGLATGVHLCYRFWYRDRQINHLRHTVKYTETPNLVDEIHMHDVKAYYDKEFQRYSSLN